MLRNLRQQGFGKIGGGEEDQVVDLFPHAHKTDGQAQLFVHTDDAATLGGAVQLGQHNAGGTGGAAELLRLADGVLAGNGIQHQQHFQAGIRAGLFHAAADLCQFIHQALFVVQAACGIGNDHIIAAGRGGFDRIKNHGCGVSALARLDQRHPGTVGPGFQLFAGRCAEGIACRQHDPLAQILVQISQLGNGGGFAHAVHAHNQNNRRFAAQVQVSFGAYLAADDIAQGNQRFLAGMQAVDLYLIAQLVHQTHRAAGADIGQNQLLFQIIIQVIINNRAGQGVDDVLEKVRSGFSRPSLIFFFFLKISKNPMAVPPLN